MTFISAFRCNGGIIIGADSQETHGDYKLVVDKLVPINSGNYQIALGGAGIGDLVDSLLEHVQEWVSEWDAATEKDVLKLLRPKLREFYQEEVAAYPDTRANKRITAILCLKHRDNPLPMLFEFGGTVVKRVSAHAIVGWDMAILSHFIRRLYKQNIPISQGVFLTLYLFSLVGSITTVVGKEDTRILIARDNGIHVHDRLYVAKIQENISLFTALIDRLVLSCPDTSLQEKQFEAVISEFVETSRHIRKEYLYEMGRLSLWNALQNPKYAGDAYNMIPLGATIAVPGGEVREETLEEIEELRKMFEAAKQDYNQLAGAQLQALLSGRQILYLGKEKVHVRGTAGPAEDSVAS